MTNASDPDGVLTVEADSLLPCPFCGAEAAFGTVRYSDKTIAEQNWGQDTFHSVNCIACGTNNRGAVGYRRKELAAKAWNRRTPSRVAELECARDKYLDIALERGDKLIAANTRIAELESELRALSPSVAEGVK